MFNIRQGVFETNSSSSHSLTLVEGELGHPPFSRDQLRDGVLRIELGEYGWEWRRMYRPLNKASYLLTDMLCREGYASNSDMQEGDIRNNAMKNPRAAAVIRVLEEESGCRVQLTGWGYVDHQSTGTSANAGSTEEEIRNFLFSPSYITTGNDNEEGPDMIKTDYGTGEPLYSSRAQMEEKRNGYS